MITKADLNEAIDAVMDPIPPLEPKPATSAEVARLVRRIDELEFAILRAVNMLEIGLEHEVKATLLNAVKPRQ